VSNASMDDTALALTPTQNRNFHLARMEVYVDGLSYIYKHLRQRNDKWNKIIMVTSAIGALITSILTIAKLVGWPYEIVPIVIQTASGVIAAWMRFYDFPRRMEEVINTKHAANETLERLHKAPLLDEQLWEQISASVKGIYSILTPTERDRSHKHALKHIKRGRVRDAQLRRILAMTPEELLSLRKKDTYRKMKSFSSSLLGRRDTNGDSIGSESPPLRSSLHINPMFLGRATSDVGLRSKSALESFMGKQNKPSARKGEEKEETRVGKPSTDALNDDHDSIE